MGTNTAQRDASTAGKEGVKSISLLKKGKLNNKQKADFNFSREV